MPLGLQPSGIPSYKPILTGCRLRLLVKYLHIEAGIDQILHCGN